MNRTLLWLLLPFGLIMAAAAGLFLYHHRAAPSLTASPAAQVAPASPVQVTGIERRKPDMLIVHGRAPAGATVTLGLDGSDEPAGAATAAHNGAFELNSRALPREPVLPLAVTITGIAPLRLLVIDRAPQISVQPLTLVQSNDGWQPLTHPRAGGGILIAIPGEHRLALSGQAPAGSTVYLYADGRLVRTIPVSAPVNAGADSSLFAVTLEGADMPKSSLRGDAFGPAAQPVAQFTLKIDGGAPAGNDWQKVDADGGALFVWRDLATQATEAAGRFDASLPGQFLPVVPVAAPATGGK